MHDNGKFAKHVFYDVRGTVADAAPVVRIGEPLFAMAPFCVFDKGAIIYEEKRT